MRKNEGEAALYGITYDDSSYDYMSHLRTLNAPGGGEVMLLPAPKGSAVPKGIKTDRKGKGKAEDLFGLPEEMFASKDERTMKEVYESAQNIPDELRGLQPDMDPHLRQVLEALDDEAFVDGEGEDIFDQLLGGGEKADGEEAEEFDFEEWGVDEDGPEYEGEGEDVEDEGGDAPQLEEGQGDETWEDRFKAFKAAQKSGAAVPADASEVDDLDRSEMADTIGSLSNMTDLMVIGGKRRRGKRGPSDATGMSMSSSSMFRNEGLRDLDERFDKVCPFQCCT
jgi:protein LTV1